MVVILLIACGPVQGWHYIASYQLANYIARDFQLQPNAVQGLNQYIRSFLVVVYKENIWCWEGTRFAFEEKKKKSYIFVPVLSLMPQQIIGQGDMRPLAINQAGQCFNFDFFERDGICITALTDRYIAVENMTTSMVTLVPAQDGRDYLSWIDESAQEVIIREIADDGTSSEAYDFKEDSKSCSEDQPVNSENVVSPGDPSETVLKLETVPASRRHCKDKKQKVVKFYLSQLYSIREPRLVSKKSSEWLAEYKVFMADKSGGQLTLEFLCEQEKQEAERAQQKQSPMPVAVKKKALPAVSEVVFKIRKKETGRNKVKRGAGRSFKPRQIFRVKYHSSNSLVPGQAIDLSSPQPETALIHPELQVESEAPVEPVELSSGQVEVVAAGVTEQCPEPASKPESETKPSIAWRTRKRPCLNMKPGEWDWSDYRILANLGLYYDWWGQEEYLRTVLRGFQERIPDQKLDEKIFIQLITLKALCNLECLCSAILLGLKSGSFLRLSEEAYKTDLDLLSCIYPYARADVLTQAALSLSQANFIAGYGQKKAELKFCIFEKERVGWNAGDVPVRRGRDGEIHFEYWKCKKVREKSKAALKASCSKIIESMNDLADLATTDYMKMETQYRFPWLHACWNVDFDEVEYFQPIYELFPEIDSDPLLQNYVSEMRRVFHYTRNFITNHVTLYAITESHLHFCHFQLVKLLIASQLLRKKIVVFWFGVSPLFLISFSNGRTEFMELEDINVENVVKERTVPELEEPIDDKVIFLASPDLMHYRRVYNRRILEAAVKLF
ncbi:hypothetical protein ACWJJH_01580 [Endozoicomonadaceae bacterium StTr2]